MSLHVVMAGSSGFLGSRLRAELERRGHRVTALVRRPAAAADESQWDPYRGEVDRDLVAAADVVVNLAGAPTMGNPHSRRWARALRDSRVATTSTIADAVAGAEDPPYVVVGNAVAWYGDHGAALLTEAADTRGHAFMTEVCREWQAAARPAVAAGARVVHLRTAPVMDAAGSPLKQLALLFRTGLGGRIGNGRQYFPVISLRDWVGAAAYLVEHPTAAGAVNLTCVETPTNAEFTRALARQVRRPALAPPVPGPLVRLAGGRLGPEVLASMNLRPQALLDLGYEFADPDVEAVLASGLS